MMSHSMNPLSNEQLAHMAPSIFAQGASSRVSNKYSFLPTVEVVNGLRGAGWFPISAGQQRTRAADRYGFQKHIIRFRRDLSVDGDSLPELVLVNSHDGGTSYQLHAGIFRIVCMNGMIVADTLFQKICVKHVGFEKNDLIEASYRVLDTLPTVMDSVDQMQETQLSRDEQRAFADAALTVRYDGEPAPVASDQLLVPRRLEDRGGDLWKTLNVVQENIIRGGLDGWSQKSERKKRIVTRPVNSIDRDISLNKALWQLAEKMKELKSVSV